MKVKGIIWSTLDPSIDPAVVKDCFPDHPLVFFSYAYKTREGYDDLPVDSPKRTAMFIDYVLRSLDGYNDVGYIAIVTCPISYLSMVGARLQDSDVDGVKYVDYTCFVIADDDVSNMHIKFTEQVHDCSNSIWRVAYTDTTDFSQKYNDLRQGYLDAYVSIELAITSKIQAAQAEARKVAESKVKPFVKVLCLNMIGDRAKADYGVIIREMQLLGVNVLWMPEPAANRVFDYITALNTIASTIETSVNTLFLVSSSSYMHHTVSLINSNMEPLQHVTLGEYAGLPKYTPDTPANLANECRNFAIAVYNSFIETADKIEVPAPEAKAPAMSKEASFAKLAKFEVDMPTNDMATACDLFGECFAWVADDATIQKACEDTMLMMCKAGHMSSKMTQDRVVELTAAMIRSYRKYKKIYEDSGLL